MSHIDELESYKYDWKRYEEMQQAMQGLQERFEQEIELHRKRVEAYYHDTGLLKTERDRLQAEVEWLKEWPVELAKVTGLGQKATPTETGDFVVDLTNKAIQWRDQFTDQRERADRLQAEHLVEEVAWAKIHADQRTAMQGLADALKAFIQRRQHISPLWLAPDELDCLEQARAALAASAPLLEDK